MKIPPITEDPYVRWRAPLPEPVVRRGETAFLIVDMQYFDADWDSGAVLDARNAGYADDVADYGERLKLIVPNIQRVMSACREHGIEVMFVKIESMTSDGRDRPQFQVDLGYGAAPGSRDGDILDELKPAPGEIVLSKSGTSVFNGTVIDKILRNSGIKHLLVAGVSTSGCVSSAVRDAADLGYSCTVIEDCCGAFVDELHWAEIRILRGLYARVRSTDEIVDLVEGISRPTA